MLLLHSFCAHRTHRTLLVFAAIFAVACGALPESEIPTGPDSAPVGELPEIPPDSTPGGIGGGATPTPTPDPNSTPSDNATPTPPPAPTPTPPPPSSSSCRLPAMPECGGPETQPGVYGCCREESSSLFASQVEQAQRIVFSTRPDLFNSAGRVIEDIPYTTAVAQELERMGLCATSGGPPDEVGVKNSNGFNEQYDVVLGSTQQPWTNHTVTCRPSRF